MPQLPPANNVLRVVPHFTYNGEHCANVLHYIASGERTPASLTAIGQKYLDVWRNNFRGNVPGDVTLNRVEVSDLSANGVASVDVGGSASDVGMLGQPAMPNNVTCVASLRTALRGRSYRGRVYHIGIGEGDVTGNMVLATRRANLEAGYAALRVLESTNPPITATLCVLSYFSGGTLRGTPLATPVTTVSMDGTVDTQRRRLPGR